MIDVAVNELDPGSADFNQQLSGRIEEYATECSMVKVWSSEFLTAAAAEGVRTCGSRALLHGTELERAWRDAIGSSFLGGTNEINRLIISGWFIKRAMKGRIPAREAFQRVAYELSIGVVAEKPACILQNEEMLVRNVRKLALLVLGSIVKSYGVHLADQQEVLAATADLMIGLFAIGSSVLRAEALVHRHGSEVQAMAKAMAQLSIGRTMPGIEAATMKIVMALPPDDRFSTSMAESLLRYERFDALALRRQVAAHLLQAGQYSWPL
jgi:butyryl-CoA dehydrogenase